MKTVELSGKILYDFTGSFEKIYLVQEDGYKIDLIGRFAEIVDSWPGANLQVNYHLNDTPLTTNEAVEKHLIQISGGVQAEYETSSYNYSSWTQGTDYESYLTIGGHNLLVELKNNVGKYVIFIINIKTTKP